MPKGQHLPAFEVAAIMARYKKLRKEVDGKAGMTIMGACQKIGGEISRDPATVWAVVRRMTPTVDIATDYFRANAFRMAHKVVNEASAPVLVDILSRPNIGVLDPIKSDSGGGGGFFLSVQAESCGAVTVAVQQSAGALAPPSQANNPESPEQDGKNGVESPRDPPEEAPYFVARSYATRDAEAYRSDKTLPRPDALAPRQRRRKGDGKREEKRRLQAAHQYTQTEE